MPFLPNELLDLVLEHSSPKQVVDSRLLSKSFKDRIDTGVPHQYKLVTTALGIEPRYDRPMNRELDKLLQAEHAICKANFGRTLGKRFTFHLPDQQAFVRDLIAPVNDCLLVAGGFIGEDRSINGGPIATSVELYKKGQMVKMWELGGFQYQNWVVDVAENVVALIGDLREVTPGDLSSTRREIICLKADTLSRYNREPILLPWHHTQSDPYCRVSIRGGYMAAIQIADENREYRCDTCNSISVYRWKTNEKVAEVAMPKHHRLFSAEFISKEVLLVGCGRYAGDTGCAALLRYDLRDNKLVHVATYEYPPLPDRKLVYDCAIRVAPVSLDNRTDGNRLKDGEGILHITFLRISIPEAFPAPGSLPQRNLKSEVALISSFTCDEAGDGEPKLYRWNEWMPKTLSTTRSVPRVTSGSINGYRLITQGLSQRGRTDGGTVIQSNNYNPASVVRQKFNMGLSEDQEQNTQEDMESSDKATVKDAIKCYFPHLRKTRTHPIMGENVESIRMDHEKLMLFEVESKGERRPEGVYITTLFRDPLKPDLS